MKYTPLMPFLIAAAFYIPHAHAAGQPVAQPAHVAGVVSRTPTARALPAAPGYTLLLTALGLTLLAVRRPQNEAFTNPA